MTERCAIPTWPQGGAAHGPWQIAGPRHARLQAEAARGCGPAASGGFDTARARTPEQWQVGTKEQALQSNQGTNPHTPQALAVTMIRRLQSSAQWWAGLNFAPHTEILTLPWEVRWDSLLSHPRFLSSRWGPPQYLEFSNLPPETNSPRINQTAGALS